MQDTRKKKGGKVPAPRARKLAPQPQAGDLAAEWLDKAAATVTYEEAGELARRLTLVDVPSDIYATILLLIAAATYEPSSETIYVAALRVLMPQINAANDATDQAQLAVLRSLRAAGREGRANG